MSVSLEADIDGSFEMEAEADVELDDQGGMEVVKMEVDVDTKVEVHGGMIELEADIEGSFEIEVEAGMKVKVHMIEPEADMMLRLALPFPITPITFLVGMLFSYWKDWRIDESPMRVINLNTE